MRKRGIYMKKRSSGIIMSYLIFFVATTVGIINFVDTEDYAKTAPVIKQIISSEYQETNDIKKAIKKAKKETNTHLNIQYKNSYGKVEIYIYKEYGGKIAYNEHFYIDK